MCPLQIFDTSSLHKKCTKRVFINQNIISTKMCFHKSKHFHHKICVFIEYQTLSSQNQNTFLSDASLLLLCIAFLYFHICFCFRIFLLFLSFKASLLLSACIVIIGLPPAVTACQPPMHMTMRCTKYINININIQQKHTLYTKRQPHLHMRCQSKNTQYKTTRHQTSIQNSQMSPISYMMYQHCKLSNLKFKAHGPKFERIYFTI